MRINGVRRSVASVSAVALTCLSGACLHDVLPPLTEKTYLAAARHCHSKEVIRMGRGVLNAFWVNGLTPPDARNEEPPEVRKIECVRRYLRVPSKDLMIVTT